MGTHPIFESDFDCLSDKMSTEAKIPEAELQNVNLKPTETVEKVILPSAEDVNRERVPLDAANFQKENLKSVTTTEPANRDINLMKVQNFDQSKLKKVETNEKSILDQEKSILEAANYDQSKLNKVEAVEKNVLPTD